MNGWRGMTFYVLLSRGADRRLVGPYRSFKGATGDAKAWDMVKGWSTCVLPVTRPDRSPVFEENDRSSAGR